MLKFVLIKLCNKKVIREKQSLQHILFRIVLGPLFHIQGSKFHKVSKTLLNKKMKTLGEKEPTEEVSGIRQDQEM